jgi:hypothetical protein
MKKRSDTVVLAGTMRSTRTAVQLTMLVPTRPMAHTLAGYGKCKSIMMCLLTKIAPEDAITLQDPAAASVASVSTAAQLLS